MTRATLDYTSKDAASLTASLLELARERLPVWRDFSPNDLGVVLLEAFAYLGDALLYYQDRIANESYLDTALEPRSVLNLLRLIGYELEPSKPASVDLDLLFDPENASGTRSIEPGTEFLTTSDTAGAVISFRYLGPRLTINLGENGDRPEEVEESFSLDDHKHDFVRFRSALSATHVDRQVKDEIIGSSDASQGQRFALAQAPVVEDTLHVYVTEGGERAEWTRVRTLFDSAPGDKHYQIRRDETERVWIEFGNGIYGAVPSRNVDGISASYLVGGGTRGNVPKASIVKVGSLGVKPDGSPGAIDGLVRVYHEQAASGGSEREALDVAAERAPLQFRSQQRIVTDADHVAHALEFGVAKARAFRGAWNHVKLYVATAGGGDPSDALLEQLRTRLEEKRVMTTILEVLPPVFVNVKVNARLDVEPNFFQSEVKQAAAAAVQALFAFDKVDFGQTLFISKLYEALEALPGVQGAFASFDLSPNAKPDEPGVLRFRENEIPRLAADGLTWDEVTGGQT